MILHNGRPHFPHDVPPGANVRPFVADVVPIRRGDPYTDAMGHPQIADADGGLIVQLGQIVCAERMAAMLGQHGWKCKRRGGGEKGA